MNKQIKYKSAEMTYLYKNHTKKLKLKKKKNIYI